MGKQQKREKRAASDVQEVPPMTSTAQQEPEENKELRYVVVREGHRVSPDEYETPDDPRAIAELEFWRKVANNHSWGEPVAIVKYDNKLHRVW